MSLWKIIFGGGARDVIAAATDTIRVVRGDQSARDAQHLEARTSTLDQFAAEFAPARNGPFDSLVDGLNRLPRPMLAFATLALFAFAMWDPVSFAVRMQGIALIPEPLWWLMGTVVAFYFGAREAAHFRRAKAPDVAQVAALREAVDAIQPPDPSPPEPGSGNAALEDWRQGGDE